MITIVQTATEHSTNPILLTTIHHTGTNSVMEMLKDQFIIRHHIIPHGLKLAKTNKYEIITTYREPKDVAESWRKRNHYWKSWKWRDQWDAWAEIVPFCSKIYHMEELTEHMGKLDPKRVLNDIDQSDEDMLNDIIYAENLCSRLNL
jgi:hypothetical protein